MDKESLEKLPPSELSSFLQKSLGIPESICQAFEEELVDGAALLDLTEEDVKGICKKIGPTKNICRFICQMLGDAKQQHNPVQEPCIGLLTGHSLDTVPPSLQFSSPPSSYSAATCNGTSDSDDCSSVASSSSSFHIPGTWRPSIMECINSSSESEARRLLTPAIRSQIVRDLVTQMYTMWTNPKSAESTLVARKLVAKYPFMKDKGQGVSGYGSWERKIIDRIHNVSTGTKRRETNESENAPVSKRGRPKSFSVKSRYPPLEHCDFGDDTSFSRNTEKIKNEMCAANPRKQILLKLMEETYARRREMILGERGIISVSYILDTFPCLKLYPIITQEVSLVLGKDVLTVGIENWMSTWVGAIVDYSESLKSKAVVQAKLQFKESYKGDEEFNEKLALSMLVHLLGKKSLSNIYCEYELMENPDEVALASKTPYPLIGCFNNGVAERTYFIFIEGRTIMQLNSFSKAVGVWLMSHYIYNLEYYKDIKECALFLQEFVFSLPSKQKKTSSYLAVTTSIKSFADP